ncbi:MAG TPA: hybrid sensor histidine kinase/response regulator [Bacteroidales bacterium]|nr:hybrid sensor histidine kinase/response regulator [Bacteroidales bacterium]HPF02213.1 hybrid sensor histidine kinase/response regulator [Bacteroidales bacterium]HPJ59241.1 hybrid sensor histidine kinase/response regulator [Bacteroidales bacterium]HPR11081.1 hybrid sensor histidine kinase/response regulator [Bacteroidales bacterium]HRW86473.1 hybrid sensor histidine kinase/response regulator [Bacteroidales bacterium]
MGVLKILVIDDEPGIRSGVTRILKNFTVTYPFMDEDFSFEITEAPTGEEGIRFIETDKPDIILLDNKLPGIQGVEVLEYIRERKYDIVVAMITSYASLDVAIRATRDGATDFIPKPFTPQELKSSIENITKQLYLRKVTDRLKQEGKKVRYQFLSVLSHELKAPLNALEGYLRMMHEKQAGDRIDDYADHIDRSLQRIQGMRNLIMDLLDFTKIRLERKEEKIQEVDLAEVARAAVVTVQPYAIQMEVTVTLDLKNESKLMADPEDMEIIFNNLISNAVKYNKFGGKAEIRLESTDNEVLMVFSDTGIGISVADRENLFREFMRVRNERTKHISGSGLGLSIVKKVIELYHGTIKVESTPDRGSTFTVLLPKKQSNKS